MDCPNFINKGMEILELGQNKKKKITKKGQKYFHPWLSPDEYFTLYIPLYLQAILFKSCSRSIGDSFFKSYLFFKTALKNIALE